MTRSLQTFRINWNLADLRAAQLKADVPLRIEGPTPNRQLTQVLLDFVDETRRVIICECFEIDRLYRSLVLKALADVSATLLNQLRRFPTSESNFDLLQALENLHSKVSRSLSSETFTETNDGWEFLEREASPTISIEDPNEKTLLEEICDWLTTEHQSELLAKIANSRHPDTGKWFFNFEPYLGLRDGAYSILLVEGLR